MKNLSFQEAFGYLLQGKKIRRESFLPNTYWVLNYGGHILLYYDGDFTLATMGFAFPLDVNDWEVLE